MGFLRNVNVPNAVEAEVWCLIRPLVDPGERNKTFDCYNSLQRIIYPSVFTLGRYLIQRFNEVTIKLMSREVKILADSPAKHDLAEGNVSFVGGPFL